MLKRIFFLLIFSLIIFFTNAQMILEFDTNLGEGTTITLPLAGVVDVTINWGDGVTEYVNTSGNINHQYTVEGVYDVRLNGNLTIFGNGNYSNAEKLLKVLDFGDIGLRSLENAFRNATNLIYVPNHLPSSINNISRVFFNAASFNSPIGQWDISNIDKLDYVFFEAASFNQDISDWDVSNITTMTRMFYEATSFNQNIGNWDVSKVEDMYGMFAYASSFNQDISNWQLDNITSIAEMFKNAESFNQDVSKWNISQVTSLREVFYGATSFDQDLSNWDVSDIENMHGLFAFTKVNFDMSSWDVSKVTTMRQLFHGAKFFNQDLSSWDVSNVRNMHALFNNADAFNQAISSWNVSNVTKMETMFGGAISFNQPIGNWDVSNVTNMLNMFRGASSFNQDINNWDVSKVTTMRAMFQGADSFDKPLNNWNIALVEEMDYMFTYIKLSTAYYNEILINWSKLNVKRGLTLYAGNSKYSSGQAATARQYLIDNFGWTITDGGLSDLPAIQTDTITEIEFTSALSGGIITSDAGSAITTKGIVWNTSKNPTLVTNLGSTSDGSGIETYSSNLSGLTAGETYYVRAYATNSNGTEYGNQLQFIPKQEINITGSFTANDKVYDGKPDAELTLNSLAIGNTVTGHDDIEILEIDLVFNDKNVGQNKLVAIEDITLQGSDSLKYKVNLNTSPTSTASITPKNLTIINPLINHKIYDGILDASIFVDGLEGVLKGDSVFILDTLAIFNNKNVGTSKTVTPNITLTGADTINYTLLQPTGLTANITKKELVVTNAIADNKVYDGTITTTISATLEGKVSGDNIIIADSTANFDNKNVGTSKSLTSNITLTGTDTINYNLIQPSGLTANITKKELTINNARVNNKVYDGTTETLISGATLEGVVSGDDLVISDSMATFDNKNVGSSKTVTSNITLSGDDVDNYSLTQPTGLTADITKKELTITDATADNKVYDGTISSTVSGASLLGVVSGDDLTILDSIATFNNKNVGTSKAVTSNITLKGTDTINYSLTQPTGLTADITKKELTIINAIADNKVYDGTIATTISGTIIEGVVSGDELTISDSTGTFENKNAGTSKTVTSNITLTGTDTINYSLTQPTGLTADITKKELRVTNAAADNKVYDGTTTTSVSGATIDGVISGDDLVIADSYATFDNKNVGTSKTVTSNITLAGADTINYSLTHPTNLTADITKKELTITDAVANNKIYDGSTSIDISNASLSGLVSGDDVAIQDTLGTVIDKNVGESKEVSTAITLSGADTINYYLTQPTGLTVDITPKTITLSGSFTVEDKDYDETTNATIKDSYLVLDGVISPDIVTLSTVVLNFMQVEIGNNITVTITEAEISGDDAQNYELSLEGAPTATANIVEPVAIDKTNNIELSVYPNPFDNQLNIDVKDKISSISITTISGKVIKYQDGTGLNNINVSQLLQGVYLVNVVLENNLSKTFKMIKK